MLPLVVHQNFVYLCACSDSSVARERERFRSDASDCLLESEQNRMGIQGQAALRLCIVRIRAIVCSNPSETVWLWGPPSRTPVVYCSAPSDNYSRESHCPVLRLGSHAVSLGPRANLH